MKEKQKAIAIRLRKKGLSLNAIKKLVGVSKGSLSVWVRHVKLTPKQKKRLEFNRNKREVVERRRLTRLANELERREEVIEKAKNQIDNLSEKELRLIGSVLYWAEGGKTKRMVRFSNGDPQMIRLMMKFFREICGVKEDKFRGYIHIHPHLDVKKAEQYWSGVSKIPLTQFYKTYSKPNKSSKNLRDSLPFGTFEIYVCDVLLFLNIQGWREKIQELYLN